MTESFRSDFIIYYEAQILFYFFKFYSFYSNFIRFIIYLYSLFYYYLFSFPISPDRVARCYFHGDETMSARGIILNYPPRGDVCVEQTIVYLMITRVKISAPTNDVSKVNKVKIYEQRWIYVGVEGALTRQAKGEM